MLKHNKPSSNLVPGFWDINTDIKLSGNPNISFKNHDNSILIINDALDKNSTKLLRDMFLERKELQSVSIHGLMYETNGVGSLRATGWSEYLAEQLTHILLPFIPDINANDTTATDWWQNGYHREWTPVAISPMLRFMKYTKDSQHYAHYDAGYFYDKTEYRTLKSVVIYLTTNNTCCTRFIKDNQENMPIWDRNLNDWNKEVENNDLVLYSSKPDEGKILIFDHRLCHDVSKYDGKEGDRIIIRGDVIYKRK